MEVGEKGGGQGYPVPNAFDLTESEEERELWGLIVVGEFLANCVLGDWKCLCWKVYESLRFVCLVCDYFCVLLFYVLKLSMCS